MFDFHWLSEAEKIAHKQAKIAEKNNKEAFDYQKGFHDGMRFDKHYPETLSIMGYNFKQIIEILLKETKMPTKTKMTRKEAIECFQKHMPDIKQNRAAEVIDFYIEAGMLEIVEELHSVDKFAKLALIYIKEDKYLEFMSEMDKSELKIVQK